MPGTDVVNIDPLFVDPLNDDFHLQGSSPVIDAGINQGIPLIDFEGEPRLFGAAVDMGADEYRGILPPPPLIPNEPLPGQIIGAGLIQTPGEQYRIRVPEEAKLLAVAVQGVGNIDMHIRAGEAVEISDSKVIADFSLVSPDGNEFIVISDPIPGWYWIAVENMEDTEQEFTIIATPVTAIEEIEEEELGEPISGEIDLSKGLLPVLARYLKTERGALDFMQYKVEVPEDAESLEIRLEGLEGKNVDLHIRYGEPVEIKDGRVVADLSSISLTGEEAVVISGEFLKPGTYYIAVEGLEPPQEFKITITIDRGGGHQTAALTPFRMV